MRFYNVDVKGKMLLERRSSDPTTNEESRIYYKSSEKGVFYNDSTANVKIWSQNNVSEMIGCVNAVGGIAQSDNSTCFNGLTSGQFLRSDVDTMAQCNLCVCGHICTDGSFGWGANCLGDPSNWLQCSNFIFGAVFTGSTAFTVQSGYNAALISQDTSVAGPLELTTSTTTSLGIGSPVTWGTCFKIYSDHISYAGTSCFSGDFLQTGYFCQIGSFAGTSTYFCNTGGNAICAYSAPGYGLHATSAQTIAVYGDSLSVSGIGIRGDALYGGGTGVVGCGYIGMLACGAYRGICGIASGTGSIGVYGCGICSGLLGCSDSLSSCAVYGCNTGGGAAVAGNTGYCNTSSKYLKYTTPICISDCLKQNPLNVYYYTWEDSNSKGFNGFIGPLAEDFNKTFNTTKRDIDGYDGLSTVDGVALGLGLENLKEIDKLKDIVTSLYSCIQKLEEK